MQLTFMYNSVLLYMLIFLVANCVWGVVGTSFLILVGQREDSWVGSILRHIGWTETHYTKTHVRTRCTRRSYQSRGGLYPHW